VQAETDIDASRRPNYETSRPDVQQLVPAAARNILDLGCSTGAVGEAIKLRQAANVVGVELSEAFAAQARERLDRVVVSDIETFICEPAPAEAPFDCLIAADVLEHLVDPWETLRRAVPMLSPGATVIVSVPNVFYWKTLLPATVHRRWPREDEGIFDRTHLRWFGPKDAAELLSGAGLTAVVVRPQYWALMRWLPLVKALARTPVGDFLAAQHLATGLAIPSPNL
jgi:2-polyprenyl-3-methyl-5-hydroxy-6-metoxy-1,4-benzoquinol methylase